MKIPHSIMMFLGLAGCSSALPSPALNTVPHRIVAKHPGIAANQPRPYTLSQTLDQHGRPAGYAMEVDSVICTDDVCKVVKVMIAWDALGVYQSYTLAAGSVLEKAKTTGSKPSQKTQAWAEFTQADHAKLHQILRDSASVLRTQQLSSLDGYRHKSKVDGVTGATPITLKNAVVQGAALSSYHLWHWANGEVCATARELTHQRCDVEMLRDFLGRAEPHYVRFALEHLRLHKFFSLEFVSAVVEVCSQGDTARIDAGLAYLRAALPADGFYAKRAMLFVECDGHNRIHLLQLLDAEKKVSGGQLDRWSKGLESTDTYYELHLFLNLAEKHKHVSPQMLSQVSRFLESDNFFIARRAYRYLEKQTLDEPLKLRVEAFREKCKRENRILH